MNIVKNTFIPSIIILLAAAMVVVVALPLAGTEWADGFRVETDISDEANGEANGEASGEASREGEALEQDGENSPAIAMMILPVFKVVIFMGIGALLTIMIRRFTKRPTISKQDKT